MNELNSQLSTQVIVSAICLFVGGALKNTPITRWAIPFLVAICGGAVYCGYVGEWSVANFILGFYAGAASTGIYEATRGKKSQTPPDALSLPDLKAKAIAERGSTESRPTETPASTN